MGNEVPRAQPNGRPSLPTIRDALSSAHLAVFGLPALTSVLEGMLAQVSLETAEGASLWQNNVGNITVTKQWQGDYWRPTWYEPEPDASAHILKLHEMMLAGKLPRAFRAYPSLDAGARDYVSQLKSRFPSIIEGFASGDMQRAASAIQSSGYCPDCAPLATAKTLSSLRDKYRSLGIIVAASGEPLPPLGDRPPAASSSSLSVSGIWGSVSPVAKEASLSMLARGSEGSLVGLYQRLVNRHNGSKAVRPPSLREDGNFGPLTEAATKRLQSEHGLTKTGVVDAKTWEAL